MTLGAIGELSQEIKINELAQKLFPNGEKPSKILPFGKEMIKKVAVISGGAGEDFTQAVKIGADAYITGEVSHEDYHGIEESGINVIAGGHYNTETVGVQLVQKQLEEDKGLQTVFIDIPTGL